MREKGFRDLKPIAPDYFGYSVIRNSVWSEYYRSLLELGEKMDFPIEGLHEETGPGVIEAAIGCGRRACPLPTRPRSSRRSPRFMRNARG